jgi:hypothetical protein
MNKYEAIANAVSITLAIQITQLLADGNWKNENRLKAIGLAIDIIPVLRLKNQFPIGGIISKSSQSTKLEFGESIFPPLKFPAAE